MNETLTKRREKLFSAFAESNFSFSETKFRDKYSRWMSADPAMGDYIPASSEQAKKLPANGVYSLANLNLYHYGANNPLRYKDPTGMVIELAEGATDEQKAAYEDAVKYICSTEKGKAIYDALQNDSKRVYTVSFVENGDSDMYTSSIWASPKQDPASRSTRTDENGNEQTMMGTIFWAPNSGLDLGNGNIQSAATGLLHEMGHAKQDREGKYDVIRFLNTPQLLAKFEDRLEADNLSRHETPFADSVKEPTRSKHSEGSALDGISTLFSQKR